MILSEREIKTNLKFYLTSAGKPTFHTQSDTVSVNFQYTPWRKYRIRIHSESIRTIPIHTDICIRVDANHSDPIRKTFCNLFDEKW